MWIICCRRLAQNVEQTAQADRGFRIEAEQAVEEVPLAAPTRRAALTLLLRPARGRVAPQQRQRQAWRYGLEEKPKAFQVIPRRWVVGRIFAWLSRSRRLARDYGCLPGTGLAMIHAAMSRIMLQRLA